jgi:CRP/FNR family transcriptional regulator, cyclic AMP receptor protein
MAWNQLLRKVILDPEFKANIEFLRKVPLFADLSDRALGQVLTICYEKSYGTGEIVFDEGAPGKALYIIKSGEVVVTKQERTIAHLHTGDFFGEMALLEECPRSATVTVTTETVLLFIYKVKFDGLLEERPSVGLKVVRNLATMLSSRLRKTDETFASLVR